MLQVGQLNEQGSVEFWLDVSTVVFSFLLFSVTIYAWTRRGRQPTLLIVSFGFLTFFIKQLVEVLPLNSLHGELFSSIMDFVALALFFVALVVRPQRKVRTQEVPVESSEK